VARFESAAGQGTAPARASSGQTFCEWRQTNYFSEVFTELNMVFRLLPRPLTAARIAIEMPALYRFRISHKVISIALLSFAGLLSFGAIYQISSSSQDVSHAVAENAASIADLNQRTSIKVLDARRAENDFQLRHDETFSKLHAELSTSINHDFDLPKLPVGVSVNL
jgi:hypothetical protein